MKTKKTKKKKKTKPKGEAKHIRVRIFNKYGEEMEISDAVAVLVLQDRPNAEEKQEYPVVTFTVIEDGKVLSFDEGCKEDLVEAVKRLNERKFEERSAEEIAAHEAKMKLRLGAFDPAVAMSMVAEMSEKVSTVKE